ncbi:BlaI/MecI/CopY family transcriptional regulator [Sphingomonas sp. ID1715]|uniref:BlaI/MecI/CopY family transcriptional regulator n=1 Tax=Sphingomonas sp. ID1715 TaxID=1656898 RepID=UPI001489ADD5|nr:BlaI/MecI/CopY family transcriptional regulator [Sphingomonas sp. ID1715]NNM75731.1 BlaI/MecI/CopY family transcriptional regulator [Sphingomonas sp. ID1715]
MAERISEAEHAVMEVLWEEQPLTAAEVAERAGPKRGWSVHTVKTLLSRLMAKGAITHEADGRRFLYRPAIERDSYVGRESEKLVDRLFGGRVTPLIAQLAERRALSADDIAELEALLRELKP